LNPRAIVVESSHIDERTFKNTFDTAYVYITIYPQTDSRIRVFPQFTEARPKKDQQGKPAEGKGGEEAKPVYQSGVPTGLNYIQFKAGTRWEK
jgi:hypothetical protein